MDISYLVLYGGLFIVALLCLSRLFAIVLSKILSALIKKDISIDYIGIVSFKNVTIQLNNSSSVAIDAIWLTWKLFNPNQTYPAVLHIGDIRIQADIEPRAPVMQSERIETKDVKTQGSSILESGYFVSAVKFFIQVLSVDISVINLMLLHVNTMGIDSLVHFTVSNVSLLGEVLSDKILSAEFSVEQTAVRVLRSAQQEANKQSDVAQASTRFKISTQFNIIEKSLLGVSMTVSNPSVSLHDGFLLPGNAPVITVPPDTPSPTSTPSTPTAEKITAIFKQIPKDMKIQIDNVCIKINLQTQQRALTLNSKSVCFTAELDSSEMISCSKGGDFLLPSTTAQFFCTDVHLTNLQARKLFSLTNVTTDMQVQETGISADVSVRHCHTNYADKEFSFWAHIIKEYKAKRRISRPLLHQQLLPSMKSNITLEQVRPINFIEQFCLPVDLTFDLNDMSSYMIWPKLPCCSAVLSSLRSAVHITTDAGSATQKPFRYIRGSVQGEQLYCHIGDSVNTPVGATPSRHIWGTPCAINTVNIKVNITPMLLEIEGAVQSLKLESSQELQQVIQHCVETLCALRSSRGDRHKRTRVKPVEASITRPSRRYQVLLRLEDIDAFVCSDIPECLTLRVDGIEVDSSSSDSIVTVEGIKFQRLKRNNKVYQCLPYVKLAEGIVDIEEISCKHTATNKRLLVEVQETCCGRWNTTTHMSIYHHAQEIVTFVKSTKEIINPKHAEDIAAEVSSTDVKPPLNKDTLNLALNVRKLVVHYDVSFTQTNSVIVNELYVEKQGSKVLKATSTYCIIGFDGHPIFTIKSACIEKLVNNLQLLDDRKSFDNLTLSTNKAWGVFAKSLEVEFPYGYDFAQNYNEIINLKKWFKMLHSNKKGPSYEEPLYADVLVRIQTITVQINDDPFEVKLGDNYELMKDEKKESLIREQLLDDKVSELRQTHGELLPAKRIDELYSALERKNMDIYVKRSQRLYSSSPMRKALLVFTVTGAEISALADPSMNGKENIVRHMREIDSASPYPPEDELDFTTLWCRMVRGTTKNLNLVLRDYPQSIWEMEDWHFWGRVLGAEEVGASRAKRECTVEVGKPWGNVTVIRSMPALKFYHDLATDITAMHVAYGPTIEPGWATVNLAMDLLNKPSIDPSKPLAFWDKMRLLYHGRLTASVQQCNMLWLATRDPSNTTECLDWEWKDVYLDWTNAHWLVKGDLDIYVRTASKYDDVRLVHFPNFRLDIGLEWLSNGDINDHHSVMPCAPDKVPEHSPNLMHDSYAAFRSQNLNLKMSLDIKGRKEDDGKPECLFYSTTMRWLQNFQATVIGGVTRPTRRGKLFNNTKPRKPQLSRHYKCIDFNAKFPTFQINYWASFNKQRGIEMCLGKGSISSKHGLQLVDINDDLIHRSRADWSIVKLDFDIGESHAYLYTASQDYDNAQVFSKPPADKHHMATVARVVYSRQQSQGSNDILNPDLSSDDMSELETELDDNEKNEEKDFTHKLVVTEFCGSWTRFNRDAILGLYDSYNKAQMLKQNLSTDALKEIKVDSSAHTQRLGSSTPTPQGSSSANTPSPMTKLQTGYGATLLNQLLSEATTKFMVFSEENSGGREQLYGMKACTTNDVMLKNWHIELVNSQVMLKGCETTGYAIVCAVNVQLTNCSHWPAWRDNQLTNKATWVGKLDGLQYFATVESSTRKNEGEVKWIPLSIIERTVSSQRPPDVSEMVGSGESVGGVVSDTVGASSEDACGESGVQLQRIMSRCSCQIYYASYMGNVDPNIAAHILHPDANKKNDDEEEDGLWTKEEAVDSMTLVYHDLDMCTNSAQYDMIMDIINNLLLYVEPKRKEAMARMQHMRFSLQLSSIADQKMPIVQLQNSLRNLLSEMRQLEKNLHNKQRSLEDATGDTSILYEQIRDLEMEVTEVKESLANASEDLRIMVSCFKEIQLQRAMKRKLEEAQSIRVIRRVEVCIGLAQWKLTEADGQLGIADLQLRQFKYTRTSKSDDSGENLMELGWVYINNLIANDIYQDVLRPQEASSKGKQVALRVIARGKPPVGGISVTENFEVNVVPLNIQLSFRFFKKMMAFFFPGRDVDHTPTEEQVKGLDDDTEPTGRFSRTGSIRSTGSGESIEGTLPRETPVKTAKRSFFFQRQKDDIDKMKERAARNNTFFYIKIPAVPLCVSYKGEKDKNIEDVTNFHLTLPSLEYHNCTWTWLDLLMAMKKEYKQALLSQAIKEKLKFRIRPTEDTSTGSDTSGDSDKAKLLMGPKASNIATEEKSSKRALFGKGPSNH